MFYLFLTSPHLLAYIFNYPIISSLSYDVQNESADGSRAIEFWEMHCAGDWRASFQMFSYCRSLLLQHILTETMRQWYAYWMPCAFPLYIVPLYMHLYSNPYLSPLLRDRWVCETEELWNSWPHHYIRSCIDWHCFLDSTASTLVQHVNSTRSRWFFPWLLLYLLWEKTVK